MERCVWMGRYLEKLVFLSWAFCIRQHKVRREADEFLNHSWEVYNFVFDEEIKEATGSWGPGQSWPSWRSLVSLRTSCGRSGAGEPNLLARQPAWNVSAQSANKPRKQTGILCSRRPESNFLVPAAQHKHTQSYKTWETRSGWTVGSLTRRSSGRCPAGRDPSCRWTHRSGSCGDTNTHSPLISWCSASWWINTTHWHWTASVDCLWNQVQLQLLLHGEGGASTIWTPPTEGRKPWTHKVSFSK